MLKKVNTYALAATTALTASGASLPAQAQDLKELTVTLPVNICLANWPFYVAADSGIFAEEGLEVTMEGLNGSSAAIQAMLAGQAQIAVSAPADMLAASSSGADVTGFYSFYQYLPFRVIAPANSEIATLADLAGKTIGISSVGGGDAIYMRSLMSYTGVDDSDYSEMVVGEGNSAAMAFNDGVVDAYSASFVEEIVFTGMGISYNALSAEGYPETTGLLLVGKTEFLDENPDTIAALGRGLARATRIGLADRDAIVTACGNAAPHEVEDTGFVGAVLDGVDPLFTPLEALDNQYGVIDEGEWAEYRDLMVEIGIVGEGAADTQVSNVHVSAWNQE